MKKSLSQLILRSHIVIKSTQKGFFSLKKHLLAVMLYGVLSVVVIQGVIIGANSFFSGRPILGLHLNSTNVGISDSESLVRSIRRVTEEKQAERVTVSAPGYKAQVTARQLGAWHDESSIKRRLIEAGRKGSLLDQLIDQDKAIIGLKSVSLGFESIDPVVASKFIKLVDRRIMTAPKNAYFELNNQSVVIRGDNDGVSVEEQSAIATIRSLDASHAHSIALPIHQTHAQVTKSMLEPLQKQAQGIASQPLKIVAGPSQVTLSQEDLVSLIEVKVSVADSQPSKDSQSKARLSFNEGRINSKLDALLQLSERPATPKILSGSTVISPGSPGLQAGSNQSVVELLAALLKRGSGQNDVTQVDLKLQTIDPPVVQQNKVATRQAAPVSAPLGASNKRAYLTFDDGPGLYTEAILNILKRYNVQATFYVVGRNALAYPATVKRIAAEGNRIGNHSYTHANLPRLTQPQINKELVDTQTVLKQLGGSLPTTFRPPYGSQNDYIRRLSISLGMSDDLWSNDPRDWAQPGSQVIAQRVLNNLQPGGVVLLHILHQQTVDALPSIIEGIRARGYTMN